MCLTALHEYVLCFPLGILAVQAELGGFGVTDYLYLQVSSGASLGDILGAALNKAKGEEGDEPAKPKRKRAAKGDAETAPEEE